MVTVTGEQLLKEWLVELRTGERRQAVGFLYVDARKADDTGATPTDMAGPGYCCLGVLCDIAQKHGLGQRDSGRFRYGDETKGGVLPYELARLVGLKGPNGGFTVTDAVREKFPRIQDAHLSLIGCNDTHRLTFPEIADLIEMRPEGMFV